MVAKRCLVPSTDNGPPYSALWEAGGLIFVAGQIHQDTSGQLIGSTIEERLAVTVQNVSRLLEKAGLSLSDVIRVTLYLTDIAQLPALNRAYVQHFQHPLPARTTVAVAALPLGAQLEMDVIAAR